MASTTVLNITEQPAHERIVFVDHKGAALSIHWTFYDDLAEVVADKILAGGVDITDIVSDEAMMAINHLTQTAIGGQAPLTAA